MLRRQLEKLILPAARPHIRRILGWCDGIASWVCATSRPLAGLYYWAFSRRFDREHHAVLRGRRAYRRFVQQPERSSPMLRRNVHRLEKGLVMQPRRAVFGEDYIADTVAMYQRSRQREGFSRDELRWAREVLEAYFDVVTDTAAIAPARQAFLSCPKQEYSTDPMTPASDRAWTPAAHNELPATDITFAQIHRLFRRRRSVRWYRPEQVPSELLQQAINAAVLAPSACNRQPFRFLYTTQPERAREIAECAGGTQGFAHNLPALVVAVGDLSCYQHERDRHLIYIDSALALMQLMLAVETLGLSSCPINWPDVAIAEHRIQQLLELADYERVVMLMAVGWGDPDGGVPYSQKKQDAQISHCLDRS